LRQPVAKGAVLASSAQVGQGQFDKTCGMVMVAARQGVPHRIAEQSVFCKPSTCRGVQFVEAVGVRGR